MKGSAQGNIRLVSTSPSIREPENHDRKPSHLHDVILKGKNLMTILVGRTSAIGHEESAKTYYRLF